MTVECLAGIMYPFDADRMVERFIEKKPPLEPEVATSSEVKRGLPSIFPAPVDDAENL